jgi:hypothetical protein
MWGNQDKILQHYSGGVIAYDSFSAKIATDYLNYAAAHNVFWKCIEIIDLERYKTYNNSKKVIKALQNISNNSFIFITIKN